MMTKTRKKEAPQQAKEKPAEPKQPNLCPTIANGILVLMGKPANLHEIAVKHLWDNRYRVNVWCDVDGMYGLTRRITDSFFIWSNPLGDIVEASPKIEKKYTAQNPRAIFKGEKKNTIADILRP